MVALDVVGFVHGVMNTDNMSILGVTIDYGPYGWLEPYDLDWTPNTTDFGYRRYAYGQQPGVALWNLSRLAAALSPLVTDREAFLGGLEAVSLRPSPDEPGDDAEEARADSDRPRGRRGLG